MADGLLEAVRGLHLAHPELGPKPLLAKLRAQQPDLAAGKYNSWKRRAQYKAPCGANMKQYELYAEHGIM